MTPNETAERAAFQLAMMKRYGSAWAPRHFERDEMGYFIDIQAAAAFEGWEAARAASPVTPQEDHAVASQAGEPREPTILHMRIVELSKQHGSLRLAAQALGVNPGYLSRLASGEKENPSDELLAAMGLGRSITIYHLEATPSPRDCDSLFPGLSEAIKEAVGMLDHEALVVAARKGLDALRLAAHSHDVRLLTDPPQDAWKRRRVSEKLADAINELRRALGEN